MARRFFFVSLGVLALAIAWHLTGERAWTYGVLGSPTLPATGLPDCYDDVSAVSCPAAGWPNQDADNIYNELAFTLDMTAPDQPTVIDENTGLEWTRGRIGDVSGALQWSWRGALILCDTLHYGGHDDWRVPNVKELVSIMSFGQLNNLADPIFGILQPEDAFWTSTTSIYYPSRAYIVLFAAAAEGQIEWRSKGSGIYVIGVRTTSGTTQTEKASWGGVKSRFR